MRKLYIILLIFVSSNFIYQVAFSQGVAINNSGLAADASAMLDVQSSTGGMLVPRMDLSERGNIGSPATGLLIYQTTAPAGFYYNSGSPTSPVWVRISNGEDLNFLDGTGVATRLAFWTDANTLSSNSNLYWDNSHGYLGIGISNPLGRLHVVDDSPETVAGFDNKSANKYATGAYAVCDEFSGTGIGLIGFGGWIGLSGSISNDEGEHDGPGERIGVWGNIDNVDADEKYGVRGTVSGPGINYGIYGQASGGTKDWAGYFAGNTYISGNTGIGTTSPSAQLHTTGNVRFANYTNGFLLVDGNGNLGVSAASSLFSAGTGLSWSGSTLNSVWTILGNNIYNNNTGNIGIGTNSPSQKLQVNGNIKLDDNMMVEGVSSYRVYRNLATYNSSSNAASGAFVITTSQPWNSTCMFRVKIEGYFYDATSPFELIAAGYIYNDNSFYNTGYINVGAKQLSVRFARNISTNTLAIIIGTEGDSYSYPKITVTSFMQGHNNINEAYADGWTIAQYTSLANFDNTVSVPNVTTLPTGSNNYIQNQSTSNQSADFRISGNGYIASNMGIGTTSPSAQLHTTGTVRFQTLSGTGSRIVLTDANGNLSANTAAGVGLISGTGTTNYVSKWTGTNTQGNSQLFDNGTNVGIGTTSPSEKLTVAGGHGDTKIRLYSTGNGSDQPSNLSLWASEPGVTYFGTGIGYNVNGHPYYGRIDATRGSSYIRFLPGETKFEFQNSSGTTINDVMVVKESGNIGIGTSSPASKLHINAGSARISGSTNTNAETGGMLIYSNSSGLGKGTAKKVERYSKLTMSSNGSYEIYDDFAVTLYAYRSGDYYYIRLSPKTGYNGWWDYSEESAGDDVNCSTVGTQYTMSSDWGVGYTGGFELVINRESNSAAPTYRIRPHLHSSTSNGNTSVIVEAYYP